MSGCGQCFRRFCCLERRHGHHHPMPTHLVVEATSNAATSKDRRGTGSNGGRVVGPQSPLALSSHIPTGLPFGVSNTADVW